jgi:hypothetical protein
MFNSLNWQYRADAYHQCFCQQEKFGYKRRSVFVEVNVMNATLQQRLDRCQHLHVGSGPEQAVKRQVYESGANLQPYCTKALDQTSAYIHFYDYV